jgi:hypothetical protein
MKNRDDNETDKIIQEMKESSAVLQTQIQESNDQTGQQIQDNTDSKLDDILDSVNQQSQVEPPQPQPTNIVVNHAPNGTIAPQQPMGE